MVIQRIVIGMLLWLAVAATAMAASDLQVSVDHHQIHSDETLKLSVVGDVDINISLDSLFNLPNLKLPEPDLTGLDQDFDILDRRQSYNIQSVNGNTQAVVTWTYVLAPKRTGTLTIPALSYKGSQSEPIDIKVVPGTGPSAASATGPASVTTRVDTREVFTQQQVVLTETLRYQAPLLNGSLGDLNLDSAIVEPLGEPEKSTEIHNGQRYQVVKRRYALFAQKPGTLTIPAMTFTGQGQNPMTGQIRYLRAASDPIPVTVKAPPQAFQGQVWLPATSLLIHQSWSEPPDTIHVGDSVTRTIKIEALGQLSSALPPLDIQYPPGVKTYPDQPKLNDSENNGTLDATRTETAALVPTRAGPLTLPEVRISWWDTLNNVQREAVLPSKTLQILPAAGTSPSQAQTAPPANASKPPAKPKPTATNQATGPDGTPGWVWVIAILAAGWILTLLVWWLLARRRRVPVTSAGHDQPLPAANDLYRLLRDAVERGDADGLSLLPRWVQVRFNTPAVQSVADVKTFFNDATLSAELEAFERHLYANPEQRSPWQPGPLLERLEMLRRRSEPNSRQAQELPPLYQR